MQDPETHGRYIILRNCRDAPSVSKLLCDLAGRFFRLLTSWIPRRGRHVKPIPPNNVAELSRSPTSSPSEAPNDAIQRHAEPLNAPPGRGRDRTGESDRCEVDRDGAQPPELQLQDVLERQFRRSMTSLTRYHGPGYDRDKVFEEAVAQTPPADVWDTRSPFTAAMCKPLWVSAVALAVAVTVTANLAIGFGVLASDGMATASRIRFTALDAGSGGPLAAGVGFLRDGCAHASRRLPATLERTNVTLTVSYGDAVAMNGFWVTAPPSFAAAGPRGFRVDVSDDEQGRLWKQVAVPSRPP